MQSPQNYRWQNGNQDNRKTNSTQSALARRERQGCTCPPPPSLHSYIGSLQNFCFRNFAKCLQKILFRVSRNLRKISRNSKLFCQNFVFRKIQNYFVKILCFTKFKLILSKFHVSRNWRKISRNTKLKILWKQNFCSNPTPTQSSFFYSPFPPVC